MTWRGAALVLGLLAGSVAAQDSPRQADILGATYGDPTARYPHGALGDPEEWGSLVLELDTCPSCAQPRRDTRRLVLPEHRVFEDTAPRLHDVDGDGANEVVVVESDRDQGARLAIYDAAGPVAATPFIGQANRWLAPVEVSDLDGDGHVELAYVDRPHLARVLRVWRFLPDGAGGGRLVPVAAAEGHTNHRFGDPRIGGGLRDCGGGVDLVTASADWSRILASRLVGDRLLTRDLGPLAGPDALDRALAC